jgi:hypothetical protein
MLVARAVGAFNLIYSDTCRKVEWWDMYEVCSIADSSLLHALSPPSES